MNYKGKHVLVLGLGESGLASAIWLIRGGGLVRVADTRTAPKLLPRLLKLAPTIEFIVAVENEHVICKANLLDDIDFIIPSPGLSPGRELKEIFSEATKRNIPIWSEVEIFFQALVGLRNNQSYKPKVNASKAIRSGFDECQMNLLDHRTSKSSAK